MVLWQVGYLRVRNDLVDFENGSGKDKDSDHAPVEIIVQS